MAKYASLDDGSYLIERDDGPPLRTAVDPVDYGYELRPPEELAGYVPRPPTNEERMESLMARIEKTRRGSDPEYEVQAVERDRVKEYEQQEERTRSLGESLQRGREEAPPHLQPTARLDDFGGEESRPVSRADFDSGSGGSDKYAALPAPQKATTSASWDEAPGEAPKAKPAPAGRVRVTQPQSKPEQIDRTGSPVATSTPGASQQDPERAAIGDMIRGQIVKRSGPSRGGWSPTTVTTQREGVPTPEALAGREQAARGVDATGDALLARKAQMVREQIVAPELSRLESEVTDIERAADRRKKYDAEIDRLRRTADEKEKAADDMPRINAREDYWADKGIFARILAAISAGAFQFGQGLAGRSGPNIPIEMTEAAIAENAEVLRLQHEDAEVAGKKARNAYSEALATYGDPESAQKALRLEGQAVADKMMDLRLRGLGSDEELMNWELQKAQRKEARALEYAYISAKAAGTTIANERYTPASSGSASIDPRMVELWLKVRDEKEGSAEGAGTALRQRELEGQRQVWLPPEMQKRLGLNSRTVYAADKDAALGARSTLDVYEKGLRAISNLEKIYATPVFELNPDLMARIEANAGTLQALVGQKPLGLSQQTDGEFTRITDALRGDQGAKAFRLDSEGLESLKKAKELFLQDAEHHVRGLSRKPWELDYVVPDVTR